MLSWGVGLEIVILETKRGRVTGHINVPFTDNTDPP